MECVKYSLWLNPLRCNVFFANYVLIVEGLTEAALFGHLIDGGRLHIPRGGIFVLDALGNYNIHRFMNLLSGLGIRHAVLYDHDSGKHPEIENTIESARSEFTGGIDYFDQDIERFLCVPRAKVPHRKPQHMMWHLRNGKIENGKIDELIDKTEKILI